LRGAASWLSALCRHILASGADGDDLPEPFASTRPIRIVDGSRLEGPGERAWRLHLAYDPRTSRIADASITRLDQGERLDRLPPEAGAIYLADRGYPQPDGLRRLREAGADVLVRLTWNSLRLRDGKGRALDWHTVFAEAQAHGELDMRVTVHEPRGKFPPLPMRLVLIRKPPDAAARARASAQKASRKDQRKRTNPLTLEDADHPIPRVIAADRCEPSHIPIDVIVSG
jgi:hypothetical protein